MALSKTELKQLAQLGRKRFTNEQVEEALRYQLKQQCSLGEAAEKFGMSAQTLATRRNELMAEAGVE